MMAVATTRPRTLTLGRWLRYFGDLDSLDDPIYVRPRNDAGNFGLRFQIAFAGYALAAIGERLPAAAPLIAARIARQIETFLDPRVWRYWMARGTDLDPVGPENVQYSGHLAQLIGCYERFSDDGRFDAPFVLDNGSVRHVHSHGSVARILSDQMVTNPCHGVTCEPGTIYVACNDHAAIGLRQYDAVHGTTLSAPVADWERWTGERMVRKRGGVFAVAYLAPYDYVLPVNFQVMDAWSLAFLSPAAPALFQAQYRRWRRTVPRSDSLAWVPARWPNRFLEIADRTQNTAFGYIAAREAGDSQLADRFRRWLERHAGLADRQGRRACWNAERALMVSSLVAIGDALGPGDLADSVAPRSAGWFRRPGIVEIQGGTVEAADWNDTGALEAVIQAEGTVRLRCQGVAGSPEVVGGTLHTVGDGVAAIHPRDGEIVIRWAAA